MQYVSDQSSEKEVHYSSLGEGAVVVVGLVLGSCFPFGGVWLD